MQISCRDKNRIAIQGDILGGAAAGGFIEEGLDAVRSALALYPPTYDFLLRAYEPVKVGQARLVDVIVGFIDRTRRTSSHSRRTPQGRGNRAGRKGRGGRGSEEGEAKRKPSTPARSGGSRGALRLDRENSRPGARLHRQARCARSKTLRSASDWRTSSWSCACRRACSMR